MGQHKLNINDIWMTMDGLPFIKLIRKNVIFFLLTGSIAFMLKKHYSQAQIQDLSWILMPTANLVAWVLGIDMSYDAGAGFISDQYHIIIAPACAGVNFMITALCLTAFSGFHHMRGIRHKSSWLITSVFGAYAVTLFMNALRIIISIFTYQAAWFGGHMTWERVHRMEGIIIYCLSLYAIHAALRFLFRNNGREMAPQPFKTEDAAFFFKNKTIRIGFIPLIWYVGFTILIPALNGAYKKSAFMFIEHSMMVLFIGSLCVAGVFIYHKLRHRE